MNEKRHRTVLNRVEVNTILWMMFKMVTPLVILVIISCGVLFFGLEFLMRKASFANYGITPTASGHTASQFILTYLAIAFINIVLMIVLSVMVIRMALHNVVLPLMRIARELNQYIATKTPTRIVVRQDDRLLIPIVEAINKIIG